LLIAGRAGRKGIDTVGESVIMCANQNEKRFAEILINSKLPEVTFSSNKSSELKPSIKRALLETIVSGMASKKQEIIAYTNCFIMNKNNDDTNSCDIYLKWLESNKFIAIYTCKI
jgi:DNA polymerase theta